MTAAICEFHRILLLRRHEFILTSLQQVCRIWRFALAFIRALHALPRKTKSVLSGTYSYRDSSETSDIYNICLRFSSAKGSVPESVPVCYTSLVLRSFHIIS